MKRPRLPAGRQRVAGVVLGVAALAMGFLVLSAVAEEPSVIGMDYRVYMDQTRSWLAGDGFYRERQLHGPYPIEHGDALYPPVILYLTVPSSYLPAVLWWLVPLGIIGWSLYRKPPSPLGWLILLALFIYPRTWAILIHGNPSLWVMAALISGWYAFALIKPTFIPFALLGVRERRWWVLVGIGLLAAIPFGAMWLDYISALKGAQTSNLGYLWGELPIALGVVLLRSPGLMGRRSTRPGKVTAIRG